jgi:hypothetical protein
MQRLVQGSRSAAGSTVVGVRWFVMGEFGVAESFRMFLTLSEGATFMAKRTTNGDRYRQATPHSGRTGRTGDWHSRMVADLLMAGMAERTPGGPPALAGCRRHEVGAFVSVSGQKGVSPLQVDALRPVSEGNCIAVRRGGKQLEENGQSVTSCELDSAGLSGEPAFLS